MIRIFKLFWSFNVKNIEIWLKEKAEKGYILKDVNTIFKIFTFDKCESKKSNYRICYEKRGTKDIEKSLKDDGWYKVCNKGRWIFIANDKNEEEIKVNPSRERLLKRTDIVLVILIIIGVYYGFMGLFYIMFLLPMVVSFICGSKDIIFINTFEEKIARTDVSYFTKGSILAAIQLLIIIGLIFYLVKTLNKRQKELKLDSSFYKFECDKNEFLFDEKSSDEIEEIEEFNLIKQKKSSWMYEPDKIEKWLESMEQKGYNLYKINKLGNEFYFRKGNPRKIRFVVNYQNIAKQSSYEVYKQNGWKLLFTTMSMITKWTLWAKEYIDERPQMYTDKDSNINQAKKILKAYTIVFIPILILTGLSIKSLIEFLIKYSTKDLLTMTKELPLILFSFLPLAIYLYYCHLYFKIVKYYVRMKKY